MFSVQPRAPHSVPYCIIWLEAWGVLRTMRVPEDRIPHVESHGWRVLIRDSDLRSPHTVIDENLQSNPQRSAQGDGDMGEELSD